MKIILFGRGETDYKVLDLREHNFKKIFMIHLTQYVAEVKLLKRRVISLFTVRIIQMKIQLS